MTTNLHELLSRPAVEAAPLLLGARLHTDSPDGGTEIILTEVEAYGGIDDPASHAFRGPTARNRSMFGLPGTLYVYRSYGIHWCANISTGPEGLGQAVLLRAGSPTIGEDLIRRRRGREDHLADGPGKLTQALAITGEHDGVDLLTDGRVQLLAGVQRGSVIATPRVGISVAKDRLWRYVLTP